MSITHNKNLNLLLNLLINCISVRSAPQLLSIKGDCTFLLLNFLIIGLCNPSVNCRLAKSDGRWSDKFSFLIPLPKADLSASKADFLSNNS